MTMVDLAREVGVSRQAVSQYEAGQQTPSPDALTRIAEALPTIKHAIERGARVILASHLGRPKGKPSPEFSLKPVAARLGELLKRPVAFAEDCVGDAAARTVAANLAGGVVLLENLRFHPEEEKNDPFCSWRSPRWPLQAESVLT